MLTRKLRGLEYNDHDAGAVFIDLENKELKTLEDMPRGKYDRVSPSGLTGWSVGCDVPADWPILGSFSHWNWMLQTKWDNALWGSIYTLDREGRGIFLHYGGHHILNRDVCIVGQGLHQVDWVVVPFEIAASDPISTISTITAFADEENRLRRSIPLKFDGYDIPVEIILYGRVHESAMNLLSPADKADILDDAYEVESVNPLCDRLRINKYVFKNPIAGFDTREFYARNFGVFYKDIRDIFNKTVARSTWSYLKDPDRSFEMIYKVKGDRFYAYGQELLADGDDFAWNRPPRDEYIYEYEIEDEVKAYPSEKALADAIFNGIEGKKAEDARLARKKELQGKTFEELMTVLREKNPEITVEDSINAGNCKSGTLQFIEKIPGVRKYKAGEPVYFRDAEEAFRLAGAQDNNVYRFVLYMASKI